MAEQTRKRACPYCGGVLHYANYQRKPRGAPQELSHAFEIRFSLCCSRESCRRRTLPPSVRFWGRRVYWAPVLILLSAIRQGKNPVATLERLKNICGVWRSTLNRWRDYFLKLFPQSLFYQRLSGYLKPGASQGREIYNLLNQFLKIHAEVGLLANTEK